MKIRKGDPVQLPLDFARGRLRGEMRQRINNLSNSNTEYKNL